MKSLDTVIETFRIVLKNPKIMLIPFIIFVLFFVFIFAIAIGTIGNIAFGELSKDIFLSRFLILLLLILIISILISPIFNGMLISSGIQAMKRKISLTKAFNEAKKKYFSILGISLVGIGILIFLILIPFIFIIPFKWMGETLLIVLLILYLIFAVIVGIFILILLFEANTIVFTENKKAFDALKRSFYIGEQKALSIIATMFFLFIIVFGITLFVKIFDLVFTFIDNVIGFPIFSFLFLILVEIPVNCLISSVNGILPVVFYYNYNLKKLK
jgi:hypothetical protein